MTIVFRAAATPVNYNAGAGTSGTITIPATVQTGDFLILHISVALITTTYTGPAGWTLQGTPVNGVSMTKLVYTKVATSGDAGATASFIATTTGTTKWDATMVAYSGVDQTNPLDVAVALNSNAASTTHTTPTATVATTGALAVGSVSDKGSPSSATLTPPAGHTVRSTNTGGGGGGSVSLAVAEANATSTIGDTVGGVAWTAGSSLQSVNSTLVLRPATTGGQTGAVAMNGANDLAVAPAQTEPAAVTMAGANALVVTSAQSSTIVMAGANALTVAATEIHPAAIVMAGSNSLGVSATAATVSYLDVGGPAADGFVVVGATTAATVSLAVSTSPTISSPTLFGPVTADSDGFRRFTATGLAPFTQYYYRLYDASLGLFGPVGSASTAPVPGTATSFGLTLGACVLTNATDGVALASATTRARRLNIFTGDQSYAGSTSIDRLVHEAQVVNQLLNVPSYAAYWRNSAKILTLSDHDAGPDNGPSDLADAPYQQASIDAFKHYAAYRALADTRNPTVGRYYSLVYGRIKFIVIDVRNTDRSNVTATGTGTDTMLGATQKAWFKAELLTPEPVKIIVADTQWMGADDNAGGVPVKGDWWPAYPAERNELIAYITANRPAIGHLEYWHGDAHLIGHATSTKNTWGNFPVRCAAGMNQSVGGGRDTSTFTSFFNNSGGPVRIYGDVEFTDTGAAITLAWSGIDASSGTDVVRDSDTVIIDTPAVAMSGANTLAVTGTPSHPGTISMSGGNTLSVASGGGASQTGAVTMSGANTFTVSPPSPGRFLTAAPDPTNTPPRILIDASGFTGAATVTIVRVDAAGNQMPVRTGNPATVTAGEALVYDYEAPFGQPVSYTATPNVGAPVSSG